MPLSFNPSADIPDLTGKVFLVTGGTAGLGTGMITNLAAHNPAHIYFTGRKANLAKALTDKISQTHPNVPITFIKCDNKSLTSVEAAAKEFLTQSQRLDVLVCNAGIAAVDADVSDEGYEIQFQVNHLAHALLVELLLPLLEQTSKENGGDARIINITSVAYQEAPEVGIDFATIKSKQENLGNTMSGPKWCRYGQSKLANLLYAEQLAINHPEVTSVSVHPGIIFTDLFYNMSFMTKWLAFLTLWWSTISVKEGPYNQLWAATCDKGKLKNGEYYEPIGIVGNRTTSPAKDSKLSLELWDWTQNELRKYS